MFSTFTFPQKIILAFSALLLLSGGLLGYAAWQKGKSAAVAEAQADAVRQQVQQLRNAANQRVNPPDLQKLGRAIPNDWEMALFLADLTKLAKANRVVLTGISPSASQTGQPEKNGGSAANGSQAQAGPEGQPPVDKPPASQVGGPSAQQQPAQQAGKEKSGMNGLPPELSGVSSLEIALTGEGDASDLVSFVDQLQQMPRFVWINEYNLNFSAKPDGVSGTGPKKGRLQMKLVIFAHAPWDARAASGVEWPFPVGPAGDENAMNR